MKKFVVILFVLCLAFAGIVGYMARGEQNGDADPAEPLEPAAPEQTADAAGDEAGVIDYEALYALHDGAEIVMTVGGRDVTWEEYYAWVRMNAAQIESTMASYASYGVQINWEDAADENGTTYAQYAVNSAEGSIRQLAAIEGNAAALGFVKDEAFEKLCEETRRSDIEAICGEGATEEEFLAALEEAYMAPVIYESMNSANTVYQETFEQVYGGNGANVSDEEALAFLESEGYLSANHILFMTIDPSSGEALDEAAEAEKKAQAEELYAELAAIEDKDALVERFKELKELHCEDSGKNAYPDGYVFTPGTMVAEFEDACEALDEYGVSEPVKSSYGYHIILRLPLEPDAAIARNSDGSEVNARFACASADYSGKLKAYLDGMETVYAEGFEKPDLMTFVQK